MKTLKLPWILAFSLMLGGLFSPFAMGDEPPLIDKTLVVWVSPANLDQRGGSALTINDTTMDQFDGVVFAELRPRVWMPGSSGHLRTQQEQADWPEETVGPHTFVQIAIVYAGQRITVYRNGERVATYETSGQPQAYGRNTAMVFGMRHLKPGVEHFFGKIRDARVYAQALAQSTIAEMKPGEPVPQLEPWAWWDFAQTGTYDRAGRFNQIVLTGGAHLEHGCLVLDGKAPLMLATISGDSTGTATPVPAVWSANDPVPDAVVQSARVLREKLLADPYRPRFHFCTPEDQGMPGDPNGCFYANGRYHLMYLYNRTGSGFCWGHISSHDLVHWRHHPDAIGPGNGDEGCFSGGAFVDDDATAYLTYWMLWGDKGIGIARSTDRSYDQWEKLAANPVIKSTEWGITEVKDDAGHRQVMGSADPSNIWKSDGTYYMLTGNLLVLNKYGRQADSPASFRGDRLYLFASHDLKQWDYRGEFYERNRDWTDDSEDNMCSSFLPLPSSAEGGVPSGKHLLLFISHNKGCQYYVGDYDPAIGRFTPERHGRMTWTDNTYFAPEALLDGQGRQIMWAWLTDNPGGEKERGWSGVYGLPRTLWLGADGNLRMAPVPELNTLRTREQVWEARELTEAGSVPLDGVRGDACELEIVIDPAAATQVGLKVRRSPAGEEETSIYYNAEQKCLCFDATRSGIDGRRVLESAPLELAAGEPLKLRVFVDRSVVEVYANERQAIGRRVYPGRADSLGVSLFSVGGTAKIVNVQAWEMMPANPY